MRTLTTHRKAAAMTQAAIAAEVHQTLDVDADFTAQVALDHIVAVDHFADLQHFLIAELRHALLSRNIDLLHDLGGVLLADAMDVLKRDQHALVGRNVDAGNTSHGLFSCYRPVVVRLFVGLCFSERRVHKREHDALPHGSFRGPASSISYPTGCPVIKVFNVVSSTDSGV